MGGYGSVIKECGNKLDNYNFLSAIIFILKNLIGSSLAARSNKL